MAPLTLVKMLYCGQGMMTLVEVYDDGVEKDSADYLALIDCGGDSQVSGPAIDYIVHKIQRADAFINDIVISHQDLDHIALLKELGPKLKNIDAIVGSIFLGGLEWGPDNKEIVQKFCEEVGYREDVVFNEKMRSDYKNRIDRKSLDYLAYHNGMFMRILVSGLPVTGNLDIRHNGSSAVVVIDIGQSTVVLPGDITFRTIWEIVNQIGSKPGLVQPVAGLLAPHHGALRTAVNKYHAGGDPNSFGWGQLAGFAQAFSAKNVCVSAGPGNMYGHPSLEVLGVFVPYTVAAVPHTCMAFEFRNRVWGDITTNRGIWGTVASIGGPYPPVPRTSKFVNIKVEPQKLLVGDLVIRLDANRPGVYVVEFYPRVPSATVQTAEALVLAPAP